MGPIGCPEISVRKSALRPIKSQKSTDLIDFSAEAWYHANHVFYLLTDSMQQSP